MSTSGRRMRTARKTAWWRTYHQRMAAGLEQCRRCGTRDGLTFDHILAAAHGVSLTFENATILCEPCNRKKGASLWGDLVPLAEEEAAAPPEQRWGTLAAAEAHAESVDGAPRRPPWTSQELALLDTDATPSEVAAAISRSVKAVRNMRTRIRRGDWPPYARPAP